MSASDLTVLQMQDGAQWGQYLLSRLDAFSKIKASFVLLDEQEYENPPEVTMACQDAAVLVLLATPVLLDYMADKAGWFAKTLQEVSSTSAVVVVLLVDRSDVDEVTKSHGYLTQDWRYFDPGYHETEVRQMVADILDVLDTCLSLKKAALKRQEEEDEDEKKKAPAAEASASGRVTRSSESGSEAERKLSDTRTPPSTQISRQKSSLQVQIVPPTVYESGQKVVLVFKEELSGEVSIKIDDSENKPQLTRLNPYTYSFQAPDLSPGTHSVSVLLDGKKLSRRRLTYHSVDTAAFTSPHYLCQCLNAPDLQALDQRLRDAFTASTPGDQALETVFNMMPDATETQTKSDAKYPTLLHYAAAHGLFEFCSALLECPGSSRAFQVLNKDGLDPADMAQENDFQELSEYINDFMQFQTANEVYGHYMAMNPPDLPPEEEPYVDVQALLGARGSPPPVGPRVGGGDKPPAPTDSPKASGRSDRPPLPPPRSRTKSAPNLFADSASGNPKRSNSTRVASALTTVPEDTGSRAQTLPRSMDAKTLMGMGAGQSLPLELPKGAMGSRGQSELLDIYDMFKKGEINVNEAEMFYNSWHERYGRQASASFKDRQRELKVIKEQYTTLRELQKQSGQSQGGFLSKLGLFKNKKQTIKVNISDPVLQRESCRAGNQTKVYTRSATTGSLPVPGRDSTASTTSSGSNASSRDSGWSQGSRESAMSAVTFEDPDEESDDDDAFVMPDTAVRRRKISPASTSSTNRVSLGDEFLKQLTAMGNSSKSATLPPLPPPRRCSGARMKTPSPTRL